MKTLALLALLLLAGCGPAWTPYAAKHPKPSLFEAPLPVPWERPPLPVLN